MLALDPDRHDRPAQIGRVHPVRDHRQALLEISAELGFRKGPGELAGGGLGTIANDCVQGLDQREAGLQRARHELQQVGQLLGECGTPAAEQEAQRHPHDEPGNQRPDHHADQDVAGDKAERGRDARRPGNSPAGPIRPACARLPPRSRRSARRPCAAGLISRLVRSCARLFSFCVPSALSGTAFRRRWGPYWPMRSVEFALPARSRQRAQRGHGSDEQRCEDDRRRLRQRQPAGRFMFRTPGR